ncbi:MAG TPA: MarR family transcriptional regulator [Pseudonocardia sp.]
MSRPPHEIGASVKRLQVRHHRAIYAELAPLHITPVQWDALRHLEHNPEASLHDLARLTHQTDQAFGTLAGRMIDRGLIERVPGPGRAVRHRITDKGYELLTAANRIVDAVLSASFNSLTPDELAQFDALLTKLLPPPPQISIPTDGRPSAVGGGADARVRRALGPPRTSD